MTVVTLWAIPISANSSSCRSFLKACGIDYDEEMAFGRTRTVQYVSKFPTNLTPAIEHGDVCLSETGAILRYVARNFELARKYYLPHQQAKIDMMMDFTSTSLCVLIPKACYPSLGFPTEFGDVASMEATKAHTDEASAAACHALLKILDDTYVGHFLSETKFLMSDEPTIADFRFAPMLNIIKVGCVLPARLKLYLKDMNAIRGISDGCKDVVRFMSKYYKQDNNNLWN